MARKIEGASRSDLFRFPATMLVVIGVDTKHRSAEEHPLYDGTRMDRLKREGFKPGFVESIAEMDVIEPVEIREEVGVGWVVVDGRTRVLGAREADKLRAKAGGEPCEVPCVISKLDDVTAALRMVVHNEQRREDDDVSRARKAQWLLNNGKTTKQVALTFGVSPASVATWVRMLTAHAKVLAAVQAGTISASLAAEIATLARDAQVAKLEELVAAGETSVRAGRDNIRGERSAEKLAGDADGEDGDGEDAETSADETFEDKIERALMGKPAQGLLKMMLRINDEKAAASESGDGFVSKDARNLLAWAVGKAHTNKVAGLTGLIRACVKEAEDKRAARVAAAVAKAAAAAAKPDVALGPSAVEPLASAPKGKRAKANGAAAEVADGAE